MQWKKKKKKGKRKKEKKNKQINKSPLFIGAIDKYASEFDETGKNGAPRFGLFSIVLNKPL